MASIPAFANLLRRTPPDRYEAQEAKKAVNATPIEQILARAALEQTSAIRDIAIVAVGGTALNQIVIPSQRPLR